MSRIVLFLSLFLLLVCLGAVSAKTAPSVGLQAGQVTVVLDTNGLALAQVAFPAAYRDAPIVVVTPRGTNAEFAVERYFVDTWAGDFFVLGVRGEPHTPVIFNWLALPETAP